MLLLELFDHVYAFDVNDRRWSEDYPPNRSAKFVSENGIKFEVRVTAVSRDIVEAEFHQDAVYDAKPWEMKGTGDAFRILSTVTKIVLQYSHEWKPEQIIFYATKSDESRVRVYRRMFSKIPGYHLTEQPMGKDVRFILIRENSDALV